MVLDPTWSNGQSVIPQSSNNAEWVDGLSGNNTGLMTTNNFISRMPGAIFWPLDGDVTADIGTFCASFNQKHMINTSGRIFIKLG